MGNNIIREENLLDFFFGTNTDRYFIPSEFKINHPVNIFSDKNDDLFIHIALVGEDDVETIELKVEDSILKISYCPNKEEVDLNNYYLKKLSKGKFNLNLKFSNKYDLEQITSSLKNGLLKINIPKKASEVRKIKINK